MTVALSQQLSRALDHIQSIILVFLAYMLTYFAVKGDVKFFSV